MLGVTSVELSDATLALGVYALGLVAELDEVDEGLVADYTTVAAIPEGSRTTLEQALYSAVQLFAPYAVAVQLASSLPLFVPKTLTDGKASFSRDASAPYAQTIENCRQAFEKFKTKLIKQYAAYNGETQAAVVFSLMGNAALDTDPVTDS